MLKKVKNFPQEQEQLKSLLFLNFKSPPPSPPPFKTWIDTWCRTHSTNLSVSVYPHILLFIYPYKLNQNNTSIKPFEITLFEYQTDSIFVTACYKSCFGEFCEVFYVIHFHKKSSQLANFTSLYHLLWPYPIPKLTRWNFVVSLTLISKCTKFRNSNAAMVFDSTLMIVRTWGTHTRPSIHSSHTKRECKVKEHIAVPCDNYLKIYLDHQAHSKISSWDSWCSSGYACSFLYIIM